MSGPASSDLTGKACSPYGIQWTYDTYALAHGTDGAIVKQGGTSWFFITADYAFGHALERDTGEAVKAAGGTVLLEPCELHSILRISLHTCCKRRPRRRRSLA
jgi:branched-chain amino acid transport system substrate-binding protein